MYRKRDALMKALQEGNTPKIEKLLESGLDPNFKDTSCRNVSWSPLSQANNKDVAKLLLDHDADPNFEFDEGGDALYWIAMGHNPEVPEILETLLEYKADPNHPSKYGSTALHSACYSSNLDNVRVLLRYDADPRIRTSSGQTPRNVTRNTEIKKLLTKDLDFCDLSVGELKDVAREKKLKGWSRLKKADLIDFLERNLTISE